jgi:hypothetical protein
MIPPTARIERREKKRVRPLDEAGQDVAGSGEEGNRRDILDLELVNDRDVDQRQDGRLGVVDSVRRAQQPERHGRPDLASGHRAGVLRTERACAGVREGVAAKLAGDGSPT